MAKHHLQMTHKNLILYLHHLVVDVSKNTLNLQVAVAQIMMIPSKLADPKLLQIIYQTEDDHAGIISRQRLLDTQRAMIANPASSKHAIHSCHKIINNIKQNLDPYVCVDGAHASVFALATFIWDLCLNINNPQDKATLVPNCMKIKCGYLKALDSYSYVGDFIHSANITDAPKYASSLIPLITASDAQWLAWISAMRKKQDRTFGRINNLQQRI